MSRRGDDDGRTKLWKKVVPPARERKGETVGNDLVILKNESYERAMLTAGENTHNPYARLHGRIMAYLGNKRATWGLARCGDAR